MTYPRCMFAIVLLALASIAQAQPPATQPSDVIVERAQPDVKTRTFDPRNPLVPTGSMPLDRGRRIDYVMVRSGTHGPTLDVVSCELALAEPVDGLFASDHFGVIAELAAPERAPENE